MSKRKNDRDQFEKYLKGQMTSREAHEFERTVLNDPFEQEALEGLESEDPIAVFKDIDTLQEKVSGSSKSNFNWMRIAAAVALLAISSFVVWFIIQPLEKPGELAMESEQTKQEPPTEIIEEEEPAKDAFFAEELNEEDQVETPIDNTPTITSIPEPVKRDNELVAAEPQVEGEEPPEDNFTIDLEEAQPERFTVAEDISSAIDDSIETEQAEASGAASAFQLAEVTESFEQEADLDDAQFADEIAEESVVEVARSRSAKVEKRSAPAATSAPLGGSVDRKTPEPVNGMEAYEEYLEENLRYPEEARRNRIEGTVTLELTISASGEVTGIETRRSLGYGCDEEAIRLIREGTTWLPSFKDGQAREDKLRLKIVFELED